MSESFESPRGRRPKTGHLKAAVAALGVLGGAIPASANQVPQKHEEPSIKRTQASIEAEDAFLREQWQSFKDALDASQEGAYIASRMSDFTGKEGAMADTLNAAIDEFVLKRFRTGEEPIRALFQDQLLFAVSVRGAFERLSKRQNDALNDILLAISRFAKGYWQPK